MRWRFKLEEYDDKIEYKKEKDTQAADALSRIYITQKEIDELTLDNRTLETENDIHDLQFIIGITHFEDESNINTTYEHSEFISLYWTNQRHIKGT